MLAALAPWKIPVDEIGNKIVGHTKVDLIDTCKRQECNIGNMITDAMVEAVSQSYINLQKTPPYHFYIFFKLNAIYFLFLVHR